LIWYKTPFYQFINRLKSVDKYDYLFDCLYGDRDEKVFVYLDDASLAPPLSGILKRFSTPLVEFYTWVLINRLNPFRFKVIRDIGSLSDQDVLMTFLYEHFTNLHGTFMVPRERVVARFKGTRALKVVHLSHYGYHIGLASKYTEAAGIDLFVAENNLAKNSGFFQHYFPWYRKDVHVLPMVPKVRFRRSVPFGDRKNKAMAMGTITLPMTDGDFRDFFGDDRLQPIRHEIFNHAGSLADVIDSYINPLKEAPDAADAGGGKASRLVKGAGYLKEKLLRIVRLPFFISLRNVARILFAVCCPRQGAGGGEKDRSYFKFDVVKRYNEYRMFLCPEEVIDLPAIGFVEGMACGAAYIGKRDPMYGDLGMMDKVHYIGYDGTLEDVVAKIRYYQENEKELEEIAEAGYRFVRENFNGVRVCRDFMTYLEGELKARKG
jgi:hypothetical protein